MENVKLPKRESLILEDFTLRLRKIYNEDLVSVILYGSAASGEFAGKYSDINLLVVLRDTGLVPLSRAYGLVHSPAFRTIKPIFFTEACIHASTDVFPIEFLDMKENYRVLYGKDVLAGLKIDTRNLRFQCEHELRSRLIMLKGRYMATRGRRELEELLFKSFTSCVHILRNLLRLKGKEPPYDKSLALSALEEEFSVDTTVLNEILYARNKKMHLSHADVDGLLIAFTKELETLTAIIDRL